MNISRFVQARRITAYVLGVLCIAFGLCGVVSDHAMATEKGDMVCFGDTFSLVVMLWGGIVCLITRFHYAGGIWTVGGALLSGSSLIFAAIGADALRENPQVSSRVIVIFGLTGFVFLLGCCGSVLGHCRHRRKQRELAPNKSLQATATAPASLTGL